MAREEEGALGITRTCSQCGSAAREDATRFCGYCGSELPEREAPRVVGPFGDLDARFAALKKMSPPRGPGRRRVRSAVVQTTSGCQTGFGVVFAVIAIAIAVGGVSMGAPGVFALVPLAMAAVGIWIAFRSGKATVRFSRAKEFHFPALICDERTEVSGGEHASTSYFITLQTRTGQRREYAADSKFAGELTRGDMGFAFVRDGHLLDFARMDV